MSAQNTGPRRFVRGLALVAMSITGIILYLKMLRARRTGAAGKMRGWRRYFW